MYVRLALLLFLSTLVIASGPTSTDSSGESGETPKRLMTVPESLRIGGLVVSTLLVDILSALTVMKLWPARVPSFNSFLGLMAQFLFEILFPVFNLSSSSTGGKFPSHEVMFFSIISFVVSTVVVLGIGGAMNKSWQIVVATLATFVCGVMGYLSLNESTWMRIVTGIPIAFDFLPTLIHQWPYLTNILPVATITINNLQLFSGIFSALAHGESLLWPVLPILVGKTLLHFTILPALKSAVGGRPFHFVENHQEVEKFQLSLMIGNSLLIVIAYLMALVYSFFLQ